MGKRNWPTEIKSAIVLTTAPLLLFTVVYVAPSVLIFQPALTSRMAVANIGLVAFVAAIPAAISGIASLVIVRSWAVISLRRALLASVLDALFCASAAYAVLLPLYEHRTRYREVALLPLTVLAVGVQLTVLWPGLRRPSSTAA